MWIDNPDPTRMQTFSRRTFLESVSGGLYGSALLSLLQSEESSAAPSRNRQPSGGAPRAKSVIQLFMNGGPSQMVLFDPKPELKRQHGKPYFHKIAGEVEFPEAAGALMRSPFRFQQHGECGMWVSEVMPHLAQRVDDIAFIRSMPSPRTSGQRNSELAVRFPAPRTPGDTFSSHRDTGSQSEA